MSTVASIRRERKRDHELNLSAATIGQVLIPVDDFERGVAFDRDALGLPFRFAAPPKMAFFTCGAIRLLVGVVAPGRQAKRGSAIAVMSEVAVG